VTPWTEQGWSLLAIAHTSGMFLCLPLSAFLDLVRARGSCKCARLAATRQGTCDVDDVPALQPLLLYELDDQVNALPSRGRAQGPLQRATVPS
jgi:hypothetical protein